jgi:lipoic acid synthetase
VNVDNDLAPFEWVVACGLDGVRMTSVAAETGVSGRLPAFRERLVAELGSALGRTATLLTAVTEVPRIHVTRSRSNPGGMDVRAILGETAEPWRGRKPGVVQGQAAGGPVYRDLKGQIAREGLHTVCQEAACPNVGECWERGTATFMILGDTCTRRCGFCNVKTGKPTWNDPLEPMRVARSVAKMGLRHAGRHVRRSRRPARLRRERVGRRHPSIRMQAPWCKGRVPHARLPRRGDALAKVIAERPDVFNHKSKCVPRLYPVARRGSRWERSLRACATPRRWAATRWPRSPA